MARPIVFLSDFGLDDEFVGVCHGVMARFSPDSRIIDLAHGIAPYSIRVGAMTLARSAPHMPSDSVFLAVVDPGVGGVRRPVAVATTSGQYLVGPDNGVLSLAWDVLGGTASAVEITSAGVIVRPTSGTFHGRDVFSPAAAALAAGSTLQSLGGPVEVDSLVRVRVPEPEVTGKTVRTEVLGVDRFGNLELNARPDHLGRAGLTQGRVAVVAGGRAHTVRRAATFGEIPDGELGLVVDSSGRLALARNRGSAADFLGAAEGDSLVLTADDAREGGSPQAG